MQLVYWSEIHAVDVDDRETRLTLHFNSEKSAGIHLSMRPIDVRHRALLVRAVLGRMAGRI